MSCGQYDQNVHNHYVKGLQQVQQSAMQAWQSNPEGRAYTVWIFCPVGQGALNLRCREWSKWCVAHLLYSLIFLFGMLHCTLWHQSVKHDTLEYCFNMLDGLSNSKWQTVSCHESRASKHVMFLWWSNTSKKEMHVINCIHCWVDVYIC